MGALISLASTITIVIAAYVATRKYFKGNEIGA
jgi:hypothetical protein